MDPRKAPAILLLGSGGLPVARRIQALYPQARVLGLAGRVEGADATYAEFGETRGLYRDDRPIIALCAAGILIRSLAAQLAGKGAEPPVLAVAEDGSAVVPLLGGLGGSTAWPARSPRSWKWPRPSPPAASCASAPACWNRQRVMPWPISSRASASSPTCWAASPSASRARRPGWRRPTCPWRIRPGGSSMSPPSSAWTPATSC